MPAKRIVKVPNPYQLVDPTLEALRQLGGSGTNEEIYEKVIEIMNLPPEVLDVPHGDSGQTELAYEMAWARTHLRQLGKIRNARRGVWAIVEASVVAQLPVPKVTADSTTAVAEDENGWKEELHSVLTKRLTPLGFERLIQRMLRESGFVQVEITGRSGDGGIDGRGIVRLNGFLTFHVVFQCKRYSGAVSVEKVRDFRGAMEGRADKGLLVTTGYFTRDAVREAMRDGARPIELVDGEHLAEKLHELRLGLDIETVERVRVNTDWFDAISD
jgi:restriction system protein